MLEYFFSATLQVILCQKHLFLHWLNQNMTVQWDYSGNWDTFKTVKFTLNTYICSVCRTVYNDFEWLLMIKRHDVMNEWQRHGLALLCWIVLLFLDSFKVIHPKYSKHWPYVLVSTMNWGCSKMWNILDWSPNRFYKYHVFLVIFLRSV